MFQIYSQSLFAVEEKIGTYQDWNRPRHKNPYHHNIWHNLIDFLWHDKDAKINVRHNKESKAHAEWRLTQSISAKAVSEYFIISLKIDVFALPWITRSWIADTFGVGIKMIPIQLWLSSCSCANFPDSRCAGLPRHGMCLCGKVSKSQKNQNWNLMPWLFPQRRKSVALPPRSIYIIMSS